MNFQNFGTARFVLSSFEPQIFLETSCHYCVLEIQEKLFINFTGSVIEDNSFHVLFLTIFIAKLMLD